MEEEEVKNLVTDFKAFVNHVWHCIGPARGAS